MGKTSRVTLGQLRQWCANPAAISKLERGFDAIGEMTEIPVGIALVWASTWGVEECVKQLLRLGAVNWQNSSAALCKAVENGHAEIVRSLLTAGANPRAVTDASLRVAFEKGHMETVWEIRNAMKAKGEI